MLIKAPHRCRVCDQIPSKGYWPSRAKRYDWICPKCAMGAARTRRSEEVPKEKEKDIA